MHRPAAPPRAPAPQPPPRKWLSAFLAAVLPKLPVFSPQALANTLWGLARLRAAPPTVWLDAAVERSFALLPLSGPQELSATLVALEALSYRPPQRWLNRWVCASPADGPKQGSHCVCLLAVWGGLLPV
jgi:hypothetical protein